MKKTTQDAIDDGIVNMYWKIAKPYIVLIGMILWVITGFVSVGLKNPLLFIGTCMVGLIAVITLALNSVNNVSKSELNKPEPDEYDNFYPDRDGIGQVELVVISISFFCKKKPQRFGTILSSITG